MALVVQKYGGTSVGSLDRMKVVAERALACQRQGNDVVLIVSAMSGETNRLLGLAHQVSPTPEMRELDALAATGEQVSAALVAMTIHALGGKARSLLGHQVNIQTDAAFTKARINTIEGSKVRSTLDKGQIAVVAGFQGVDPEGNITTLGRGGSDTSAVAVAAAIKADVCEIYTDVDGVYTTDPNICPSARKIDRISYEEMLELASLGAKVLQIRSVELAMKYGVPIHVRSSFNDNPGTMVTNEEGLEAVVVAGVAYDKGEAKVQLINVPDRPGIVAAVFGSLAERNVSVDMIIQSPSREGGTTTDVTFTVAKTDLARCKDLIEEKARQLGGAAVEYDPDIVKVSIVGLGMRSHAGVASQMFSLLAAEGINIQAISTSEIKVSCLIHSKYTELAVRTLHDGFGLDKGPGTGGQH
ncbi:MAG: aspartate kinase [Myxococcales bacterium]|nr:aspartate kinase [Sorangiineae bacterium PRO1]MCL4752209.1 aspartate kinase [Myxococcales bacterium]